MRTLATKQTAINQYNGFGNQLWDIAGTRPSLDLQFSDRKDLVDATTGSNLVDFTRASSGTYVGSDGLIKTAVTNLLLRSEEFETTWAPLNVTVSTETSASPAGTLTADTITPAASTAAHLISQAVTVQASTPCIASIYVKSDGASLVQVVYDNGSSVGAFINVNLLTGVITRGPDLAGAATNAVGNAIAVGNGWYRISVGATHTGTIGRILISPLPAGSSTASINPSTTTAVTDKVMLWGAQLEQSSTVGEYIPTTSTINSAPRFDHDPTTGESLGLLVEESRTNLLTYSEDFTGYSQTSANVTSNQTIAPDGIQTADLLTCTNTASFAGRVNFTAQGQIAVISVFAKKASTDWLHITIGSASGIARRCWYNLATGQIGGTGGASFGGGTLLDQSIVDQGNGWYRCVLAADCGSGNIWNGTCLLQPSDTDTSTIATINNSIYLWGAQLEEGSFPTSYIPTEGSTVTRAADVASITGTNFSSWHRQDEGTVFAEFQTANATGLPTGFNTRVFQVSDGTVDNRYDLFVATAGNLNAFMNILSVGQLTGVQLAGLVANNSVVSGCLSYKTNDVIVAGNGILSSADNSCSIPTTSRLNIGSRGDGGVGALHGHIRRLVYWDQRLPNEVLQTITL